MTIFLCKKLNFNPRSHEGSDCRCENRFLNRLISIHAPTRGATRQRIQGRCHSKFQSTLPRGERLQCYVKSDEQKQFQSTLPRGERPSSLSYSVSPAVFQSTLPRGERRLTLQILCYLFLFQSTLPRGERLFKVK